MRDKPTNERSDRGRTDWNRLSRMDQAQIDAAAASDPDFDAGVDWSKAELVEPPRKEPISIRLDADVLDFFRSDGRGYQSRINQVLRSYMEHKKAG